MARCIAVDVGTGYISSAEKGSEDGKVVFRKVRDCFFKVDPSEFLGGANPMFGEKMLKKSGAHFIKVNDILYILGDSAYKMAGTVHKEPLRPMSKGVLNPNEPESAVMVAELIKAVAGEAESDDDIVFFCIPANPVDADYDVEYHRETLIDVFKKLGYKNINVMNEGLAVVFSELSENNFTGLGISFGSGMCLGGDTLVPLLDGTKQTMKYLAENCKDEEFWVFSSKEDGTIVPGKAFNPHKVKQSEMVRVWLDNEKYLDCTKDHRIMMRDGSYREAQDLKENDSLMPLYLFENSIDGRKGYFKVKNNKTNRKKHLHRIIAEQFFDVILGKDDVVHHKNFKAYDNRPDNLQLTNRVEHQIIHQNLCKWVRKNLKGKTYEECFGVERAEEMKMKQSKAHKDNPNKGEFGMGNIPHNKDKNIIELYGEERGEAIRARIKMKRAEQVMKKMPREVRSCKCGCGFEKEVRCNSTWKFKSGHNPPNRTGVRWTEEEKQHISEQTKKAMKREDVRKNYEEGMKRKMEKYHNHKVVKIEKLDIYEDVYDMTVEKYHNFAIDSGIFVHNCNICYAFMGMPILTFSIGRGGDYIDQSSARQLDDTANTMTHYKEAGMSIKDPKNDYEKAIAVYYNTLIKYVVQQIKYLYSNTDKKKLPNLFESIPVIVAGGTSLVGDFLEVLKEHIEKEGDFPIPISEIKHAEEPLYSVAHGLYCAASLQDSEE